MPIVDVSFAVRGAWVPQDHGYALYAALCRAIPELHGAEWLAVHPIGGVTPMQERRLQLDPQAELRVRVPSEHISTLLPLVSTELEVGGQHLTIGVPTIHPLVPAAALDARMVFVKVTAGAGTPTPMEQDLLETENLKQRASREIARQLAALGVRKPFALLGKQRLTVGGNVLVGFSMRIQDLSADESLSVLRSGVGGKRRMGCGIFRPTRGM